MIVGLVPSSAITLWDSRQGDLVLLEMFALVNRCHFSLSLYLCHKTEQEFKQPVENGEQHETFTLNQYERGPFTYWTKAYCNVIMENASV